MKESTRYALRKRVLVTGVPVFLGPIFAGVCLTTGMMSFALIISIREHVITFCNFSTIPISKSKGTILRFRFNIEVDEIFNLACPASPKHYQFDPVQTTKTSIHGAINVLGLAKRLKAKVFQASTSEIYGDASVHPHNEEYWGNVNPIGPRSCYDEGKRCAETLFFDYYRQYKLDIKVARIFNTYGPNMHPNDGRVVSGFILQALKGEPITLFGDGSQTRSFCYVDDMIEGIMRFMDTDDGFTGPLNLGNSAELSIRSLSEKILSLTGSASKTVYKPLPDDDPMQRQPNIELAKKKLNWEPEVSLDEGLSQTISYFDSQLSNETA